MSAKTTARSVKSYDTIAKYLDTNHSKPQKFAVGRNGVARDPRRFHLSPDAIEQLKTEFKETKRFPNPHNKGFYHYLVEALVTMGVNEEHFQSRVMAKVQSLMSDDSTIQGEGKSKTTAWERFDDKDSRNEKTGKDTEGRFEQNVIVLQRLSGFTPYGRKILDVGQKVMGQPGGVIDLLVNEKSGIRSLRLNLKSATPINQSKTRGAGSNKAIAAAKAAAKAPKAKAPKRKASKPRVRKAKVTKVEKTEPVAIPATETATAASAE